MTVNDVACEAPDVSGRSRIAEPADRRHRSPAERRLGATGPVSDGLGAPAALADDELRLEQRHLGDGSWRAAGLARPPDQLVDLLDGQLPASPSG